MHFFFFNHHPKVLPSRFPRHFPPPILRYKRFGICFKKISKIIWIYNRLTKDSQLFWSKMSKFVGKKNSLLHLCLNENVLCNKLKVLIESIHFSRLRVNSNPHALYIKLWYIKLGCIIWSYVWEIMNWKQSIVIFKTWLECPWMQQGGVTWSYNFHFSLRICWCHKGWAHFCRCRKWLLYVHHIANWKHIVQQQYPSKNIQPTNHPSIKTLKFEMSMDFCMKQCTMTPSCIIDESHQLGDDTLVAEKKKIE